MISQLNIIILVYFTQKIFIFFVRDYRLNTNISSFVSLKYIFVIHIIIKNDKLQTVDNIIYYERITAMKKRKKTIMLIVLALTVALISTALIIYACASSGDKATDAMNDIEANLASYKIGDTVSVENDGYIGIPVEISTFYDISKGASKPGYNGTPLIIYVVNSNVERIGKKTDVEIITSMLERGYIVQVLDYLNNPKAATPALDWSTQTLRQTFKSGKKLPTSDYLKAGTYYDTIVLPAGYDVSLSNVFWEVDKYGADGDLEKIVENWNTDLRGWFRDTIIYWRDANGAQKATQKGIDDSNPVWYSDAKGTNAVDASAENANYIKVQHTRAYDITDCTGKDGTPIDLNLYMHVVYPTTSDKDPLGAVPVMALANSSEYLSNGLNTADRPQFSGFLFNGYAGVIFDYLYQPMAQSDYFGYYDGRTDQGALTADRMNYGLQLYDDKRINTAAMRYIRYLTLTEPETYSFDIESIGVYGNSKGGWFTFLGEAELRNKTEIADGMTLEESIDARINAYTSKRIYENHVGETRYKNKKTESYTRNGVTIDGGELQPWLTYTDKDGTKREIPSYASWIYASNGGNVEDITPGHAPTFCALHMRDDFTTTGNAFGELTGCINVPSFYVIVDLGHTFAYGPDYHYGFDTYQAMHDFANYYLRGDAVKVVYTVPATKTGLMSTSDPITIKFSGEVLSSEIEKVTLVADGGETVSGYWASVRGGTEWTFHHEALKSDTAYTLTVPAGFAGNNNAKTESAYTAVFHTERETVSASETVTGANGTYFTVKAGAAGASDARIRFHVANDAANIAELYSVSNFDASAPDSATVGNLVGSVNLCGAGYYEIDATSYVLSKAEGSEITFLLKAKKAASVTDTYDVSFGSALTDLSMGAYVRGSVEAAPDKTPASKIYVTTNVNSAGKSQYYHEKPFYANTTTAFSNNKLFGTGAITEADLGRSYRVTLRVYDTASRVVEVMLNAAYNSNNLIHDYNRVYYTFMTEPNKWTDISFDYTVYEPIYGDNALQRKTLSVKLGTTGASEKPIYISDLTVTETVTDIELASDAGALVLGYRDDAYKATAAASPFAIGSTGYSTLSAALAAVKTGGTVTMNSDYTLTASDNFTGYEKLSSVTIDLNGYKLYTDSSNPVINAKTTSLSVPETTINIKNGSIYLSNAPLVGYNGSTAAGDGKVFNINLTDVNVLNGNNSRLTAVMTANTIEAVSGATVNFKLDGCTVDFKRAFNTSVPVSVFSNGTAPLTVNYTFIGGEIKVDSFDITTLWDAFKKTEFITDASGKYTTLVVPESVIVPDIAVMRDDGIGIYAVSSANAYVATYAAEKSALSTKYGLIPEQYASTENYPFVLFDENGNFIGAYDRWLGENGSGSILGAARNYVVNAWDGYSYGSNPKEAFIVMRRDYTFDASKDLYFNNLAHIQGAINIDLGGFTLANSSAVDGKGIFPADSKGFSSAAGNKIFPTTIRVTNGAIRTYNWGVVQASTWDSVGGGTIANKDFNFIFDHVTLGFVDNPGGAGLLFHRNPATSSVAAPFNMTFNDCIIDTTTKKASHGCTIFKLNAPVNQYVQANYVVNGGKIIADGVSTVTIAEFNSDGSTTHGSSVVFGKGENGEYTSYYIPSSTTKAPATGKWNSTEGKILGFFANGTESIGNTSYNRYTLDTNILVTEYGTIPDANKDVNEYPFVVFDADTKAFIGGYSTLKTAFDAAKSRQGNNVWDKTTGKFTGTVLSSVVLQRRDYTTVSGDYYDNWGQIKGTITFDMGGYKLEQGTGAGGVFWQVTVKGWGGKVYPTVLNIKNGAINVYNAAAIKANVWATVDMNYRPFTINFDNIDFGFVSGATATNLLVQYSDENTGSGYSSTIASTLNLNYNNCTFDLKTNAPASGATLFNAAGGEKVWLKTTITVKGGEIIASKLTLAQLYAVENKYGSSVKFVKDAEGNYTKLYITKGGAAPSGDIATDSGAMSYAKTETVDGETLYTLSSLKTQYGTIPSSYSSIEDYPFVIFYSDGTAMGYKYLLGDKGGNGALNAAKVYLDNAGNSWDGEKFVNANGEVITAVILMRRDYTLQTINTANTSNKDNVEYFDNLAQLQGSVTLDLGGFELYDNSTYTKGFIFDTVSKGWSGGNNTNGLTSFPSTLIIKNGSFNLRASALFHVGTWSNASTTDKLWTLQFDNVTFALQKGATITNLIGGYFKHDNVNSTYGASPYDITFNDCTFDLKTNVPTSEFTIFQAGADASWMIDCDIVVNGGTVLLNSMTNVTPFALNASNTSSIIFGKGSDGEYLSFSLPGGAAYPAHTYLFTTEKGEATITYSGTSGGNDIYTLQASIVTKYGNIPARFASVEDYPFAVFRNGQFVVATALFAKDASESALHNSKNAGSVVLLRRDYTYKTDKRYANLSQTYSVTIDLGGFTFTSEMSEMLYAQKKTNHDTTVKVINGTILTSSGPIVRFSSWAGSSGSYTGEYTFYIDFENVTFGAKEGSSPAILIATASKDLPDPLTYGKLNLTNCTIDLTGLTGGTLFDLADASGKIRVDATVTGGKIIADGFDGITIADVSESYNSLTFVKDDAGDYTKLYLKNSSAAPTEQINTAEGKLSYVRVGAEGEYGIYKLSSSELSGFTPKISVTLYSDFIFNIYIPYVSGVESIELDGESVDISSLEITEIEGERFYTLHKSQTASSAAENFTFRIGVVTGGKTVYGNWTVSIVKYAKLVLGDSDSTDVEKTLVRDILSYVRSAYIYFERANAAEVKSKIDAIIGENYDATSLPTDIEKVETGSGFDSATFDLGGTPSFLFYPETDENGDLVYDTDAYVFTLRGNVLAKEVLTKTDGTVYIKVTTYAYGICENIGYSIDGTEISGQFNIKSYYEFAKTQNNDALVSLVERLWKYSESAVAYKAEATAS